LEVSLQAVHVLAAARQSRSIAHLAMIFAVPPTTSYMLWIGNTTVSSTIPAGGG
jgi:hypothetical protein